MQLDATIASPKTEERLRGTPQDESAAQEDVAARGRRASPPQTPRGYTHELVITPAGDRWVP